MNARDVTTVALPALVIGLAGGMLGGKLIGSAPARAESAVPVVAPKAEPSAVAPPVALAAPPQRSERVVANAMPAPDAARVSEEELAGALERVSPPAIAASVGSGVIAGRVIDEDGRPLPGAVVVATRRSSARVSDPADVGAASPPEPTLEEHLREQAREWAERRAGRRRATTGADGAYALDALDADAGYDLRAYAEGYVVEALGSWYGVAPGNRVEFTARRVAEIPVQLVYAHGGAPEEGVVRVKRGDDTTSYEWSAQQPNVRLADGRVVVRGYAGSVRSSSYSDSDLDSEHASEEVSIDVTQNGVEPIRLVLEPRTGVRGRVVDDWGSGLQRLRAFALPVPSDGDVDLKALAGSNRSTYVSGGRYALLDLGPGRWAVGLGTWNGPVIVHEVVDVDAGVIELDLVIPRPDPENNLVVRAFGPAGRPLRDVDFDLRHEYANGSSSGNAEARRAPDGSYWLQPSSSGGSRGGGDFFAPWPDGTKWTLIARHAQLGSRTVELEEGQRELELRFAEPVSIRVVVEGYAGSGREGKLSVDAQPVRDGEVGENTRWHAHRGGTNLSADGEARFEHLEPGTWRVTLSTGTEPWGGEALVSRDVTVAAGEQVVTLSLPVLHDVHVYAPGLQPGTYLWLREAEEKETGRTMWFGNGRNTHVGDDHRAVFESVKAGEHILGGNGIHEEIRVVVPCGEIFVEARTPDCMRVTIGDVEGLLHQAGLRSGDLIVGANAKSFTEASEAWEALQGGGEVPLMVLRDGKTIDVTLDAPAAGGNWFEKLGGMLMPANRP